MKITQPFAALRLPFALLLITLLLAFWGWWRGTAVGPQVQVPMFYDAHYIYPRPWTQAQEAPGVPEPAPIAALYGPNRLSQSFAGTGSRLALLELWLAGPVGSSVELSLTAVNGPTYGGTLSLTAENGRFYRFRLPPNIPAGPFILTLAAPQASADQPVIARTIGGDRLGSSFLLNEYLQPGNLELYSYSRGWLGSLSEQFLPSVFRLRLQQYKPDFFKGNAFQLLLGLTAVTTAIYFFLTLNSAKLSQSQKRHLALALWAAFLLWQLGSGRLLLPGLVTTTALSAQPTALEITAPPDGRYHLVQSFSQTLWTAVRQPEPRFVHTAIVAGLPAIKVPGDSALEYALVVPLDGRLQLGMVAEEGDLRFTIRLGSQTLFSQEVRPADGPQWLTLELADWAGQAGPLILQTEQIAASASAIWLNPHLLTTANWLLTAETLAERPYLPVAANFGGSIQLIGYEVAQTEGQLHLTFYWQASQPVDAYATVFVHLLDESGAIIGQSDSPPVRGTYPLAVWQTSMVVADEHDLQLPAGGNPYQLAVGLYDPITLERWSITSADGELLPDGRILLTVPR